MRIAAKLLFLMPFMLSVLHVQAQEPIPFQPPRPPPLDPATDFDEMDEDMIEMGDDGFRPPPPPIGIPATPSNMPQADFARPSVGGGNFTGGGSFNGGKLKFNLVDGEYWEKGKKRTRGKQKRVP